MTIEEIEKKLRAIKKVREVMALQEIFLGYIEEEHNITRNTKEKEASEACRKAAQEITDLIETECLYKKLLIEAGIILNPPTSPS